MRLSRRHGRGSANPQGLHIGQAPRVLELVTMPKPQPEVPNVNITKHLGQQEMLRASNHVSLRLGQDAHDDFPVYEHNRREPIPVGTVVPLYIPIWPVGMVFEAGEGLMLRVSGHDMALPEVELLRLKEPVDENRGKHTIYTGDYASYLVLPFI